MKNNKKINLIFKFIMIITFVFLINLFGILINVIENTSYGVWGAKGTKVTRIYMAGQ